MTAIPERDLRVPKSPACMVCIAEHIQNFRALFVVQTRSLKLVALASSVQHV